MMAPYKGHILLTALLLALYAGCKLEGDGLKADMPSENAPLNAAILLTYTGEKYIDPKSLSQDYIQVKECEPEKEDTTPKPTTDEDSKDKEKKEEPKLTVNVEGYLAAYPGKSPENSTVKTSHIIFIPKEPLKSATSYCVSTSKNIKDSAKREILGLESEFEFRTQDDEEKEIYFSFRSLGNEESDFPAEDGNEQKYVSSVSTLEYQGRIVEITDVNSTKIKIRSIHSDALIMVALNQPVSPKEISEGTYICQKDNDGNTVEGRCNNNWKEISPQKSFLVEIPKKDKDDWVRVQYNKYAFGADYSAGEQYLIKPAIQNGKNQENIPVKSIPYTAEEVDEKADRGTSKNKTYWRKLLNQNFKNILKSEEDPIVFIYLGGS